MGNGRKKSWYVVTSWEDVNLTKGAVCRGDVHLILADWAKLTATGDDSQAGIQVSGEGNSLTIYGQANQTGQLIVKGGRMGAGIGGGNGQDGSNITINGGRVEINANGGACIGGGYQGKGSNITINGGRVEISTSGGAGIGGGDEGDGTNITINGGTINIENNVSVAGIGGGYEGSGSNIIINGGNVQIESSEIAAIGGGKYGESNNIFVASSVLLMAGSSSSNRIEVPHFTGYNMADIFLYDNEDMRSVMLEEGKATAYAEGEAAGYARGKAEGEAAGYARGFEDGKAEALGEMGEHCEDCPSIEVTKGDKTVKLYNPESVTFKKE